MNGIAPQFMRRTHQVVDADDLARDFVETEVGPFDHKSNWEALKRRTDIRERVRQWLEQLNVDNNPDEVVAAIDSVVARAGRWIA